MTTLNAYEQAIKDNGFVVVGGVKYALGQQPYIDNYLDGVAYQAYGLTEKMLDFNGKHDATFDDSVELVWIVEDWDNRDPELDPADSIDWENGAIIAQDNSIIINQ